MNLVTAGLVWLSTHLIVLTLLGFAATGYWLFAPADVGQGPSISAPTEAPVAPVPVTPGPSAKSSVAAVQENAPAEEDRTVDVATVDASSPPAAQPPVAAPDPPQPRPPASPPRLIGGTLPVYPLPGHDGRESELIGKAFRPPSMGQLPEAEQDPRERLVQAARRAFWNNEYAASEAAYMALISRYPGDADAFGELGNLYQAMAAPSRAIDAYYEAGVRLKLAGEVEKLNIVREILVKARDPRAAELEPR